MASGVVRIAANGSKANTIASDQPSALRDVIKRVEQLLGVGVSPTSEIPVLSCKVYI